MSARKLVVAVLLCLPMAVIGIDNAAAQVTSSTGEYLQKTVIETTFPIRAGDKTSPIGPGASATTTC